MKGEESCKMFKNCIEYTEETCNTKCNFYNPKNTDEVLEMPDEVLEEKPTLKLELSNLPKFDKKHEFFVMKHHVFQMQSVSPKKIILKYKRKLRDTDGLGDGCYIFKDQKGQLLEPLKVFAKMDREKARQEA